MKIRNRITTLRSQVLPLKLLAINLGDLSWTVVKIFAVVIQSKKSSPHYIALLACYHTLLINYHVTVCCPYCYNSRNLIPRLQYSNVDLVEGRHYTVYSVVVVFIMMHHSMKDSLLCIKVDGIIQFLLLVIHIQNMSDQITLCCFFAFPYHY